MRRWARLTWQAGDPVALAADLERRLQVPARTGGLVAGARLLDLGTGWLEVRPWIREHPGDRPRPAGRLLLEPVPGGDEGPTSTGERSPVTLHAFGWATVDLDRAEAELDPWLGPRAGDEVRDQQLGARGRIRAASGLPGAWTVLLEPEREGRVAASLARDGEGPCALYLCPAAGLEAWVAGAREGGSATGRLRPGPFGAQGLLSRAPAGPHLVVTEGRLPAPDPEPPGTIAP